MDTRYFAMAVGVIYVLAGLLGFAPRITTLPPIGAPHLVVDAGYGYLLGLFPINILHNVVHLAVGAWGLGAYRSYTSSRNFLRGLAVFYAVLTVLGLFPLLNTMFGLIPIFGHDIWLHALTAIGAAYFGFKAPVIATFQGQRV